MPDRDEVSDAFGMDGHQQTDNRDGSTHHTVYNDVTRISWDEERDGTVSHFHERLAPDTRSGHVWDDDDDRGRRR